MEQYRNLKPEEIEILRSNGCSSEDWNSIYIKDRTDLSRISGTRFSGTVRIGLLEKYHEVHEGIKDRSMICNAYIHNCTIGDNALIRNIGNYLANYTIGENAYIVNVNLMNVRGMSSFGNGTSVNVLNETGGREVSIFDGMSVHFAYIMTLYRYRPELIRNMHRTVEMYSKQISSDKGTIGNNSIIENCNALLDFRCGENTVIKGADILENGSVNSTKEAPAYIGNGVIARDFIVSCDARVDDGAVIVRTFVGQATHVGQQFSAHDSLLFSNCQFENGEACAIFAGPYTVSMHKSSLLIAGMYSFLNAGSGSNQSNHMYKLGPIHQGLVERGSKTTSDSYILWPAKIGAFSLVMGRHVSNPDTSDLPFSYLIEHHSNTYIFPGVNLKSVGTIRDAQKWPVRDKRTGKTGVDFINFNLLSPYTVNKMIRGVELLKDIRHRCGETSETYTYRNCIIKRSSLNKGIELYNLAIDKFFGNSLINQLEKGEFSNIEEIRKLLLHTDRRGHGDWIDLGGLIAPRKSVSEMLDRIENITVFDNPSGILENISANFRTLHENYYEIEWSWACDMMQKWYGIDFSTVTAEELVSLIRKWFDAVQAIDKMLYEDAKKEFSLISKVGFGADAGTDRSEDDFLEVRGSFHDNKFVCMVLEHIMTKRRLGDSMIEKIERACSLNS